MKKTPAYIALLAIWYLTASAAPFRPPTTPAPLYVHPGIPWAYQEAVVLAAHAHGVPVHILAGIAAAESDWTPGAVSRDGRDRGMFQLRDTYDRARGVRDPFDPVESAGHAARILRADYVALGSWDLAIAAYRQGAGGVLRHGVGWWYVRRVRYYRPPNL